MESFDSEFSTIDDGINSASELLSELLGDDLIKESHGDRIERVIAELDEAESESNYIQERLPQGNVVDRDDVISNIEDLISNIRYMD